MKFLPAILTALSWGVCYVSLEKCLDYIDKKTYFLFYSLLNFIIFSIIFYSSKPSKFEYQGIIWMIIAAFAAILGNFLGVKAIESSNATNAAVIEISYPIWCVLFTMLLTGENPLNLKSFLGMLLVIIGMIVFTFYNKSH
jgi:drug/metabolite transporter (DMT)-like permease